MAQQFLTVQDQPDGGHLELVDSDGRSQIIPLLPGSQAIVVLLGAGTYPNQPLVWDGISAWIPAPTVVAAETFSGIDNTVFIRLPTPSPGFPTRCSWTVESANMLDIERDNTALTRRWNFVGNTLSPLEMEAPDVGDPLIGFLGATPVLRQSLTASLANQQAQINDIVTALVNLGLVVDNRVP